MGEGTMDMLWVYERECRELVNVVVEVGVVLVHPVQTLLLHVITDSLDEMEPAALVSDGTYNGS